MSVRPYRDIHRRACRVIHVGKVPVGGDAPITVQSMTNTLTSDVKATVEQVQALERAGADIVRVSCPDQESALALKDIVRQVSVPIVADNALLGVINAYRPAVLPFDEDDRAAAVIFAGGVGVALRTKSRMTGQSAEASLAGMMSSKCAPIAFETRRSSTIETLPLPLSSWAM